MNELRVGVIGLGRLGERHARICPQLPAAQLVRFETRMPLAARGSRGRLAPSRSPIHRRRQALASIPVLDAIAEFARTGQPVNVVR